MTPRVLNQKEILLEFEALRIRLEEAEQTIEAIRGGEVDAIIVYGAEGEQVFTLEGAEQPYRMFLEQMEEGAATLDPQGMVLYANQGLARILNVPLEKLIGSHLRDWVMASDYSTFDQLLNEAPGKLEVALAASDVAVPVMLSVNRMEAGTAAVFCIVVTDLSEQKRAEGILAAERLARSILDTASEAIVVCDLDGRITRTNAAANRLAGVPTLGRSFTETFPIQVKGQTFSFSPEEPRRGVEAFVNGRDLMVGVGPLSDDEGRLVGTVLTLTDITERNSAFRELSLLNDVLEHRVEERTGQLQAANRELEGFCYSVSHDLRAPLRSIMAASMMLLEDHQDQLDTDAQSHLHRLAAAAKRMATLIDDLLKFSRLGRQDMTKQDVDLSALAQAVVEETVEREGVTHMTFSVEPGMVVKGDPTLLRMLLENLIGNSVKFTREKPDAHLKVHRDGECFVVQDNGIGFDQQYEQKIFQPFERLHTDREYAGTGIGLANVQRIVARHGGIVRAEGKPGEGAAFRFTLDDG